MERRGEKAWEKDRASELCSIPNVGIYSHDRKKGIWENAGFGTSRCRKKKKGRYSEKERNMAGTNTPTHLGTIN